MRTPRRYLTRSARMPTTHRRSMMHIMNLSAILDDLRAERHQVEDALASLERLARGRGRRRGRAPAWLTLPPEPPNPPRPAKAMPVPRPPAELVWAVSGRKRLA
jgi:hypothetical protein